MSSGHRMLAVSVKWECQSLLQLPSRSRTRAGSSTTDPIRPCSLIGFEQADKNLHTHINLRLVNCQFLSVSEALSEAFVNKTSIQVLLVFELRSRTWRFVRHIELSSIVRVRENEADVDFNTISMGDKSFFVYQHGKDLRSHFEEFNRNQGSEFGVFFQSDAKRSETL